MNKFELARREFPALEKWTYMNVAARCPLPNCVAKALVDYYGVCQEDGAHKQDWLDKTEAVRELFAQLIGAQADEVAYTKNISEGINIIAHGLRLGPGENIVLVPALEHPNIVYSLSHLRNQAVELRLAEARDGAFDTESIIRCIDERTRLVCLSAVSFLTGARADLRRISERCRACEAVLLVDAAQALGILNLDVERYGIDALAASAQKGLLGVYGIGFLYCRQELAEQITPVYLGRAGVHLPDKREFIMGDIERYELAPSAQRFELGNYNYPAVYGLEQSLDFLLQFGMQDIEDQVLDMAEYLLSGLANLGMEVMTPAERYQRAGIVSVRCGSPKKVMEHLTNAGIALSQRGDAVRFSLHMYNNRSDVERVVDVMSVLPMEILRT